MTTMNVRQEEKRITSSNITALQPGEIFVFGSNLEGQHGGGAALLAYRKWGAIWGQGVGLQGQTYGKWGAIWGQGVGLQGQTYGIPTMQGGVETIAPYVDEFIRFAQEHPKLIFLVTEIGCGIAGFRPEEIACLKRLSKWRTSICLNVFGTF